MNRSRLVVLAVGSMMSLVLAAGDRSEWLKVFRPCHLPVPKDVELFCSKMESYGQGDTLSVKKGSSEAVELSKERMQEIFPEIKDAKQAEELCQFLVWGSLVEGEEQFQKVLALYREARFQVKPASQREGYGDECVLYPKERHFGTTCQEGDKDFEIQFTAFVLWRGQGARASVDRFHYRVGRDGKVILVEKTTYLEGPCLNWQTGQLDADGKKRNQAEYDRRSRLIEGIYQACPALIPAGRGRHEGGEEQDAPSDAGKPRR